MLLGTGAARRMGRVMVAVATVTLVAGALTACSDDDSGSENVSLVPADDATGGEDGPDPTEPDDAGSSSLTGLWEGTYECGGEVALTLALDDRGGEVAASFEYGSPTGGGDAVGRYAMEGTLTDDQLSLTGGPWQEPIDGGDQPVTGLEADLSDRSDTEVLEGTAVGDGCTAFSVERTSTAPWYVGSFTGTYSCTQGATGMDLTIEDLGDRAVGATYDFYAVPEFPDVPSGSYRMEGTYVNGEMVLSGVEWIEQPEGYVMVDLRIFSERGIDPNRMYGTVRAADGAESDCTIFGLNRNEDADAGE